MASTSAISMAMPLAYASQKKTVPGNDSFKSLPLSSSRALLKEKAVARLTAAALTASIVVPDVALAASELSPSLKNFLLSIVAGGVVLTAIIGTVIGVSNFDPVKRT